MRREPYNYKRERDSVCSGYNEPPVLTNESAELCQVTGRGPMRGESPTPAPPAAPGTRAVSVSEESPRCEDTAQLSSEITNENESEARAWVRSVSNNSEGWTTTSTTSLCPAVSADYQGSCGEERTESSDTACDTKTPGMAEVKTETQPGFKRNSFLRRSDSYRRAKTSTVLLTPELDKRKSVELSNNNNKSPADLITSPAPAPAPANKPEKPKNNFFRSLRSSLSFSSLRVKKSQQRPRLNISNPLEARNAGAREVIILFLYHLHRPYNLSPLPHLPQLPPVFSPCIQMNYLLERESTIL